MADGSKNPACEASIAGTATCAANFDKSAQDCSVCNGLLVCPISSFVAAK